MTDEARTRVEAAATYLAYGLDGRMALREAIDACRRLLDAAEPFLEDRQSKGARI